MLKVCQEYRDDGRLAVVGVNLDESREKAKRAVEEEKQSWPQVLLGEWRKTDIPNRLGVQRRSDSHAAGP